MKKYFSILLMFVFLMSCGYSPIYSNKNLDFKLKDVINYENSHLNSKITKKLQSFSNLQIQKIISIKIDTHKKINVLSKDARGDPSRYEMIIDVKLEVTNDQNKNRSFKEKFNYNSTTNKFELNQNEKRIENLLIKKNIDSIIIYLSQI